MYAVLFQKVTVMFLVNILEKNICQDSLASKEVSWQQNNVASWIVSAGAFHEGDAYPFKLAFQVIQE